MSSNDLIGLMKEFGVEVRMLGTDEEPNPNGVAMADMLTEIHRLRNRVAAYEAPDFDAEWKRLFEEDKDLQADAWGMGFNRGLCRGLRIMAEAAAAYWTHAGADTPGEGE